MIRNIPRWTKQSELVEQLECDGFANVFDFLYAPTDFATGENKGFAFVNFDSEASAKALASAWHKRRLFGVEPDQPALNVGAAAIQGRDANMQKWNTPRMRRVRNPDFRPYVRGTCDHGIGAKLHLPPTPRNRIKYPRKTQRVRNPDVIPFLRDACNIGVHQRLAIA